LDSRFYFSSRGGGFWKGRRILEGAEDFGRGGGFWKGRRILEGAEDFQNDRHIWKTIVLGSEKKNKKKKEIKREIG
jgi:hypothetical protein